MEHKIIHREINSLIFAEYNPRQLTKDQYQNLKDSISRFGLVDPIIVNSNKERQNIIVGGHQRVKVAKDMNIEYVPVLEVDLTYEKERELNIRLNRNTGEWDMDNLANFFDMEELIEWGFEEDELILPDPEPILGLIDDDEVPEVEESICKAGDLWLLGEHRLLCGDATKKEDVDILMDGSLADLTITSPPYNANTKIEIKGKTKDLYIDNKMDNKSSEDYVDFCHKSLKLIFEKTNGFVFWNVSYNAKSRKEYIKAIYPYIDYLQETIIWKKSQATPVTSGFTRIVEFLYMFKNNDMLNHINKRNEVYHNYWEISNNNVLQDNHGACYPVELPCKIISINNKMNIVLDPFMGSGTTLIACEKTERKCYGMEIDPHYCDVIVKRWEQFTGGKAILDGYKEKEISRQTEKV